MKYGLMKIGVLLIVIQICLGKRLYYLDEYKLSKNKTVTLETAKSKDSYVVLRASDNLLPKEGDYVFNILPPDSNHRILASVIWYKTPNEEFRSDDHIEIISSNGTYNHTHYSGDTRNMPRYFYLDETAGYKRLIIELKIKTARILRKFEIVLTSARNCNGKDNKDDFACANSYCINEDLKCDKRNNCGDDSDETKRCKRGRDISYHSFRLGTPKISWIIALIFLAVCGAAAGFFFYRRRRNFQNNGVSSPGIMSVLTGNTNNAYPKQPEQQQPAQPWSTSYPQMAQVNNAYPQQYPTVYPPQGQVHQGYPPQGQVDQFYPPQGQANQPYPPQGQVNQAYPPQGQVNHAYAQSPPPYNAPHPN